VAHSELTMQEPVPNRETSWTIIEGAAGGSADARERFAVLYAPALGAYFRSRWRDSACRTAVDEAVQEVFVDCFKPGGALDRVDRDRSGGFSAFFYGVARNIARRIEKSHAQHQTRESADGFDPDQLQSDEDSLSKVFDRAWARALVQEATLVYRDRAQALGGREVVRVEILRLRFQDALPIQKIAEQLGLTPGLAHKEYARARESYRAVLEDVVRAHYASGEEDLKERCHEILRLLG
jgi:RNA polymerase sigma-70 factor (ECF subfamily)